MGKQENETIAYRAALKKYNKLAKKADRRMRELERFSRYEEYKDIKNYAYKKAAEMIKTWTPPDKMYENRSPRWQRNAPLDTRSLKAKIKDIESFLNMKSSTLKGIKEIYNKRAKALNEKYGTEFDWQQLAHFFEDGGLADKAFETYGSSTVLLAFGKIQKKKKQALRLIEDFNGKHQLVQGNVVIEETINKLLQNYGHDLQDLLAEKEA